MRQLELRGRQPPRRDLRPEAREKLAKLPGIILGHPGLNLGIEGHTDNVGRDDVNQKLSGQRAQSVSSYLIEQGLAQTNSTAQGFGKTSPVADNSASEGRQRTAEWKLWSPAK
jgi:outer membrane protein OmpA-like peptidoglycan-associated protein